ncbi:hypothetical protein F4803DRAFT_511558 [Xylaria telfairii]|nr:hypothetical protein F4803DRAFT_511558 [Xylaria telfairii]
MLDASLLSVSCTLLYMVMAACSTTVLSLLRTALPCYSSQGPQDVPKKTEGGTGASLLARPCCIRGPHTHAAFKISFML